MTTITESRPLAEASRTTTSSGNLLVEFISPGTGSSGVYTQAVLEAAATAGRFPAGTHMYVNHASESERTDRPERSVLDLAAVTTTAGRWDAERGAIVAEAQPLARYRDVVTDPVFIAATGVSISGSARFSEGASSAGRPVVAEITEIRSVDFVTRAGRGGRVSSVLESALASAHPADASIAEAAAAGEAIRGEVRAILEAAGAVPAADPTQADQPVTEALPGGLTADGLRSALNAALTAAYDRPEGRDATGNVTTPYVYTYVRDFTDTQVIYRESRSDDGGALYSQGYTASNGVVTLTDGRTEVAVQTSYIAVTDAAAPRRTSAIASGRATEAETLLAIRLDGLPPEARTVIREALTTEPPRQPAGYTTESRREGTHNMPEIEEGRLRQLEEDASRVPTLTQQLAEATRRGNEQETRAQRAEAREHAVTFARRRVTESNADLAPATVERIVGEATRDIPLVESGDLAGRLDVPALTTIVDEARTREETYLARFAEESGIGRVRGVGGNGSGGTEISEAELEGKATRLFGRTTARKGA